MFETFSSYSSFFGMLFSALKISVIVWGLVVNCYDGKVDGRFLRDTPVNSGSEYSILSKCFNFSYDYLRSNCFTSG